MKRTLNAFVAGVLSLGLMLPAVAQTYNGTQLQGHVTYVPVGTTLDATLTSPIDSSISKPGDLFSARLYAPMYLGQDLVLPAATTLEGNITSADKAGLAGSNGKMTMRLTSAVTPDGIRYPLSALITANQPEADQVHEDKQGNVKGRTTSSTVKSGLLRAGLWTAGGTLLGICFAPIVGGAVGAGAIAGVATGGAIGLGSNLWRKGKDVKIPSGTRVQFALDQPMAVSAVSASVASTPGAQVH
ncbi:MAG TPA: hypothetical protein V6C81_02740 [Planktothrix sp.]|jgi:hypothetical protein